MVVITGIAARRHLSRLLPLVPVVEDVAALDLLRRGRGAPQEAGRKVKVRGMDSRPFGQRDRLARALARLRMLLGRRDHRPFCRRDLRLGEGWHDRALPRSFRKRGRRFGRILRTRWFAQSTSWLARSHGESSLSYHSASSRPPQTAHRIPGDLMSTIPSLL